MIKIEKINPLISQKQKTLSDLKSEYLKKFSTKKNPRSLLKDLLVKGVLSDNITKITYVQRQILIFLKVFFDKLIISDIDVLNEYRIRFEDWGWNREISDKEDFRNELLEIFGYENRFRKNKSRGIWLAQMLNIKSCPYCNAQYTIIVKDSIGRDKTKFQFDHFFAKSKYPYLSVSLYNLIPACASCNLTKNNKDLNLNDHYHPYFNDLDIKSKFYLKYDPDPKKLTINEIKYQKLEIQFVPKYLDPDKIIKEHDKIYDITGVYNRHQDIAEDLLTSAILYSSAKIHYSSIRGLFPSQELYKRYLIGTYIKKQDILKRPLTKFRQDIAKQLKLIDD